MKYFSLDIETTGLDPNKHSILEIGVVFDDLANPNHDIYDINNQFRALINPNDIVYNTFAMKMNLNLIEEINNANFKYPNDSEACKSLADWLLLKRYIGGGEFVFAGKNCATFDLPFIQSKYGDFRAITKYKYVLDPAILYMKKDDEKVPNTALCSERAGIVNKNPHSAISDAIEICELIRKKIQ
jgi:DNA polymerase III epsilon subunit-like protein